MLGMGDRLVWCRVGSGFVLRIDSRPFVLDVGHETPIAIGVGGIGDNLCASVREGHPVVTVCQLGVRGLCLTEGGSTVGVLHAILEGVGFGCLIGVGGRVGLDGGRMVRGRRWGGGVRGWGLGGFPGQQNDAIGFFLLFSHLTVFIFQHICQLMKCGNE